MFTNQEPKCETYNNASKDSEIEISPRSVLKAEGCRNLIFESQNYLKEANVSFHCEALDIESCESNYKRWWS